MQAEEQDRAQAGTWQILPGGGQQIAGEAEQGHKRGDGRGAPRGRTARNRPGPRGRRAASSGYRSGRAEEGCSDLLDQLEVGRGPSGREPRRIAKGPEPLPEPGLAAERVALVPDDGQARLGGEHDPQGRGRHEHA